MINITIGKRRYKGPYLWSDITLEQYITLAGLAIPSKYQAYVLANERLDFNRKDSIDQYIDAIAEFSEEDLSVNFPEFYKQVITCLTTIPKEKVVSLDEIQTTQIFDFYLRPFVLSLIYNTPVVSLFGQIKEYEPLIVKRIKVAGSWYYLPETVNLQGETIPMAKEPIITYAEACDLFRESGGFSRSDIASLPLMMAIYCRKKGEKYDEQTSLQRVDVFRKATMDQVWSLFFCTCRRLPESVSFTLLFSVVPRGLRATRRITQKLTTLETGL